MKQSKKKSSPVQKKQTSATQKKQTLVTQKKTVVTTPVVQKKPLVMKVLTTTTPPPTMPQVVYSTTPPPTIVDTEQQYTIMPSPPPVIKADRVWMTTSMTPSITKTLSPTNEVMTTITPMQMITETLPTKEMSIPPVQLITETLPTKEMSIPPVQLITETLPTKEMSIPPVQLITETTTQALDNLNFVSPVVETNNALYVLSNTLYTPIPGWDMKIDYKLNMLSSLGPTTPTTQAGNVIIANGNASIFSFTNINTISSTNTQYAIIQYNNSSFNGTYSTTMSYQVHFPTRGNFKLIYYIQARPRMLASNKVTWKVKYNASQTINASIHNASTTDYSFGTDVPDWGVWKKQELSFTIPEPGTYPLTFSSTLTNFTGSTDSAIAFGAISFQTVP